MDVILRVSLLRMFSLGRSVRGGVLKGSSDFVTGVTILITPIKVLITLLTKSRDPPSIGLWGLRPEVE